MYEELVERHVANEEGNQSRLRLLNRSYQLSCRKSVECEDL